MSDQCNLPSSPSIREALIWGQSQVETESSRIDVELLLLSLINKDRVYLFSHDDELLNSNIANEFAELIHRRKAGEPIAYILGQREFWSMPFLVSKDTLIPRPDTECLVESVLDLKVDIAKELKVLDLGTGTGAIACAIASERPNWRVTAIDKSAGALKIARLNVDRLGYSNIRLTESDWFDQLDSQKFDVIVSNPPYVAENDPHLNQGDVRFEPQSALVSGEKGLDDILHIVDGARSYLKKGGWLLFEHGYNQGNAASELLVQAGYEQVITKQDLGGQDRVTIGQYTEV